MPGRAAPGQRRLRRREAGLLVIDLAHDGTFGRSGSFDPPTGAITSVNKVPLPQPASGRDELFEALKSWVEHGVAPGRIDLSSADGSVTMPICVHPKKAVHDGSGDPKRASSYQCRRRVSRAKGSGLAHLLECARIVAALLRGSRTVAYNKDQWIASSEGQLSILRPHLTPRILATMSLSAWHRHGRSDEDPVTAARAWHAASPAPPPPPPPPLRKKT